MQYAIPLGTTDDLVKNKSPEAWFSELCFCILAANAKQKTAEAIEKQLNPERGFLIPGSTPASARLDYLRSVARRVERNVFAASKEYPVSPVVLQYLNRRSSYFFALARQAAAGQGVQEKHPRYE